MKIEELKKIGEAINTNPHQDSSILMTKADLDHWVVAQNHWNAILAVLEAAKNQSLMCEYDKYDKHSDACKRCAVDKAIATLESI